MKKYFPIIISLLLLVLTIISWDYIKIPYNEENLIFGEYFKKKFNPYNEILRFSFFIIVPVITYLILYLKFEKSTFSLSKKDHNYFLKNFNRELVVKKDLNLISYLFLIFIFFDFLSTDFERLLFIDTFHDSVFLTPSINQIINKGFFTSTLYDYGFTGNNLGLIYNFIFGNYTLGSINFIKLVLILIVKILLLLISRKLINYYNNDSFSKKIFFIIFTFALLSLPNYYDLTSYFSPRTALYLLFIYLIGSALCENNYKKVKFFLIGVFSPTSLLWWFDIGFYINFLIIILAGFLLIHSNNKNFLSLILGIFLSWLLLFLSMPMEELKAFFYNLSFILTTTNYLIGIEYLKPFSDGSSRWTKALLLIYVSSILLIHLNFSKKINLNIKAKIFLNIIFISGIVIFNSALTRSDSSHIKYSSGLYTVVLIFIILFLINYFLEKKQIFKKLSLFLNSSSRKNLFLVTLSALSLFIFTEILNNKNQISFKNRLVNIKSSFNSINTLITTDSSTLLDQKNLLVLEKYKRLSFNDDCVQYFSDDNFFPYFLKKPSCTKFYLTNQIIIGHSEDMFINELKQKMPNVILYKSPTKLLLNRKNLPNAIKFIENNYVFYENFGGFIFYKKK